jgi:uncharacterized repeat protein (TIGR01451 family)
LSLPATIMLTSGQLEVTNNVTITANGALTVSGNQASRVFHVASTSTTALVGLIVSDGFNTAANPKGGGCILNEGALTISRSTIQSCLTGDTEGGGILNNGGTLTVADSTVSQNASTSVGGGISNPAGTLTVSNCSFVGNLAGNNSGGAIASNGTATITGSTFSGGRGHFCGGANSNAGTMTLQNSTLTGNTVDVGDGGGILNIGTLIASNCTISGNSAGTIFTGAGGGVANTGGSMTLTNSTVVANGASAAGGNVSVSGGSLSLGNTIVASSATATGCAQVVSSLGHNLDGDGTCGLAGPGDQSGTVASPLDPRLGPLQRNLGGTDTHALSSGSPAIDAGDNGILPASPTIDQRGLPRIVDGDGDGVAIIDIGAYELQSTDLELSLAAPGNVKAGAQYSYVIEVKNLGRSVGEGVVVTDVLPAGVAFVSATVSQGMVSAPPAGSTGTVTIYFGALASRRLATATITVSVVAPPKTQLDDIATVSAVTADPMPANGSASASTKVTH